MIISARCARFFCLSCMLGSVDTLVSGHCELIGILVANPLAISEVEPGLHLGVCQSAFSAQTLINRNVWSYASLIRFPDFKGDRRKRACDRPLTGSVSRLVRPGSGVVLGNEITDEVPVHSRF